MPFTLIQQQAIANAPKVTGTLSIFGSTCIMRAIIKDKSKARSTYHKILFTMSFLDVIVSFWYVMSTWPVPKGTPGAWAAIGTPSTCTVQGLFIQMNAGSPGLNASLAIYYLLISRYRWKEDRIQRIEPLLLGIPLAISVGTAVAGLPLKLYNYANLFCWIAPFPLGCKDSARFGEGATCLRGDNAWIYRWAFYYGPIWASILLASICMLLVYWTVLQHEKAVDKFQESGVALRNQSRRVAWQSLWYIIAFYVTYTAPTIVRILQYVPQTRGKVFYPLVLTMASLLPLQGFLNFIVYSRDRYHKYRRENPAASKYHAICVAAFSCSNCTQKSNKGQKGVEQACSTDEADVMPEGLATEDILRSEQI